MFFLYYFCLSATEQYRKPKQKFRFTLFNFCLLVKTKFQFQSSHFS